MKTRNNFLKISKKQLWLVYFVVGIIIVMSGCAQRTPIEIGGDFGPYGFWSGFWHGFIFTLSFICSLFNNDIVIYSPNNVGHLYDLGFVLGIIILFGSSHTGNKNNNKNKN